MDLFDRYLAAVRRRLPRETADDIVAEIADDLQSQIEELQAQRGRSLSEDEIVAMLCSYGHPFIVAARYRNQQHLVGPQLIPFFWRSFGVLLIGVLLLELNLGHLIRGRQFPFENTFDVLFHTVVWVFAMTVAVFAAVEHFAGHDRIAAWLRKWNPRTLPANVDDRFYVPLSASGPETIVNVAMLDIFASLTGWFRSLGLAPWDALHYAVLGLCVSVGIVAAGALLTVVRPTWGRIRIGAHILGYAVTATGFAMALSRGVTSKPFVYALLSGIVIAVVLAAFEIRTLLRPLGRNREMVA